MAEERICSKCGEEPAANGHAWGKGCKAKYQREWRELEAEMIGARNFQAGANALRYAVAHELAKGPGYMIDAVATAKWIMEFPAPQFPKQEAAEPAA